MDLTDEPPAGGHAGDPTEGPDGRPPAAAGGATAPAAVLLDDDVATASGSRGDTSGDVAGDAAGDAAGDEGATAGRSARPEHPMVLVDDPAHHGRKLADLVSWAVVALCCIGVLATLAPDWIVRSTTPTGGDMGAHVWGPAFLRDELLPNLRLTGWSPDWYAGFPAFVFYMVVPMLAIVAISAGLPWWLAPFALAALAVAAHQVRRRVASPVLRTFLWVVLAVLAVLTVPVPYEVAFKVVAVSGLVATPLAAFLLARWARVPFPVPAVVAVGAAAFLYETGYSILGGNILSTMAGEFAFSISLALSLLFLGIVWRGTATGRDRALGAVVFGLALLCHVIPSVFFAAVAVVVLLFTRREDRTPWWDRNTVGRWSAAAVVAAVLLSLWLLPGWFPLVGTVAALALFVGWDERVLRWGLVVGPMGALVAAFWFVPFYGNSRFMNDMGWEKYTDYAAYLWPQPAQFDMPYRNVVFTLAGLGIVLSIVHRARLGWWLTLILVGTAWAFRFAPQWRLWNARLLPFYYLALYLLAAIAVALVIRSLALVVGDLQRRREEPTWVGVTGAMAALVVVAVVLGGALRVLPGGTYTTDAASGTTGYQWLGIDFPRQNNGGGWARYNFEGLEERESYPEFRAVVDMMAGVGADDGCGRTMWEYEPQLDRFGTPMALMLLPYFTDGCIGSMEGLYFESSSTTPFHFLNQSSLSVSPSRAQRDLPYGDLDVATGVSHLQLLGVRYYLASSPTATEAARAEPRLTELASTGPWQDSAGTSRTWTVFEVADSGLVEPLRFLPVVLSDADDHIDGWVYDLERAAPVEGQTVGAKTAGPAVEWYQDPSRWQVPIATNGPDDWPRAPSDTEDWPRERVRPARVTDVRAGTDRISFRVDRPGSPVVVRSSYFPNWHADGAEGPYRVSPNLMVVVPTEREVTLRYAATWLDWLGWLLTAVGATLVGVLAVSDQRRRDAGATGTGPAAGDGGDGGDGPDDAMAADVSGSGSGTGTGAAAGAGPGPADAPDR